MTEKERALELYDKFKVQYWNEVDGFVIDHKKTVDICKNVIQEIIDSLSDKHYKVRSIGFYQSLEFTSDDAYVYDITTKYYKKVFRELNKI